MFFYYKSGPRWPNGKQVWHLIIGCHLCGLLDNLVQEYFILEAGLGPSMSTSKICEYKYEYIFLQCIQI